jgi:hypothetical protein
MRDKFRQRACSIDRRFTGFGDVAWILRALHTWHAANASRRLGPKITNPSKDVATRNEQNTPEVPDAVPSWLWVTSPP